MKTITKEKIEKLCQLMMKELGDDIWKYHKDTLKEEGYTKDNYLDELDNLIGSSDEWSDIHYTIGEIDGLYNLLRRLEE